MRLGKSNLGRRCFEIVAQSLALFCCGSGLGIKMASSVQGSDGSDTSLDQFSEGFMTHCEPILIRPRYVQHVCEKRFRRNGKSEDV